MHTQNLSNQSRAIGSVNSGATTATSSSEVGAQLERLGDLVRTVSALRTELQSRLGPVSAAQDPEPAAPRAPEPAIYSPLGLHLAGMNSDLANECERVRGLIDLLKI